MTIVLLTVFLWLCWNSVISDENEQAEFFEGLWEEFLVDSGLKID